MNYRKNKGFTLIEIMIVILTMAMLSTFVWAYVEQVHRNSERARRFPRLSADQEKELRRIIDKRAEPLPHSSNGEVEELGYIMNAKQFQFRIQIAFLYALPFTNATPAEHEALLAAAGREVRRAALCQDAPQWVKDLLPGTIWWRTNLPPNRWPSYKGEPPAGVGWDSVDQMDEP